MTLGHRRLAILDLSSAGSQPMSYANERYWMTFNGEIYNFIEIREELQHKGYTFRGNSDSEVIMAAYCEDVYKRQVDRSSQNVQVPCRHPASHRRS